MNNSFNHIDYIKEISALYEYGEKTTDTLIDAYEKIYTNEDSKKVFSSWLNRYEKDEINSHEEYLKMLDEISISCEKLCLNKYTCHLVLLILMSHHLHDIYKERNIDDEIFFDSLADLKWKLNECMRMHGVPGIFVAHWDVKIFDLKIFALGRLQFEPQKFGKTATVCNVELTPDSDVIAVHIPSSKKLIREEYLDSYKRAEKFFSYLFPKDSPVVFSCNSWMLFPEHKVMLPETSGIRIFAQDYTLVDAGYAKPFARPWPIFYEKKNSKADELPCNTFLEKSYVERYKNGLPSGWGHGIIIYKNGKILNTERDKMV